MKVKSNKLTYFIDSNLSRLIMMLLQFIIYSTVYLFINEINNISNKNRYNSVDKESNISKSLDNSNKIGYINSFDDVFDNIIYDLKTIDSNYNSTYNDNQNKIDINCFSAYKDKNNNELCDYINKDEFKYFDNQFNIELLELKDSLSSKYNCFSDFVENNCNISLKGEDLSKNNDKNSNYSKDKKENMFKIITEFKSKITSIVKPQSNKDIEDKSKSKLVDLICKYIINKDNINIKQLIIKQKNDSKNSNLLKKSNLKSKNAVNINSQQSKKLNYHPLLLILYFLLSLILITTYYFIEFSSIYLHLKDLKIFNKYSELKDYLKTLIETNPNIRFKYYSPSSKDSISYKEIPFDSFIDISDNIDSLTIDLGKNIILEIVLEGVMDEQTVSLYKKKTKRVFSNSEIDVNNIYERYVIYQCVNNTNKVGENNNSSFNNNTKNNSLNRNDSVGDSVGKTKEDNWSIENNSVIKNNMDTKISNILDSSSTCGPYSVLQDKNKAGFREEISHESSINNRYENKNLHNKDCPDNLYIYNSGYEFNSNYRLNNDCLFNKLFFIISILLCFAEIYKLILAFKFTTRRFRIKKQLILNPNINSDEVIEDVKISV